MPEAYEVQPGREQLLLDRQLLLSILLPLAAAGLNIIVGYTVAHWVTITASKRTSYIVSAADLLLCILAGALAMSAYRKLEPADETQPENGRRLFMAKMGLLLSAFAILVVVASTLVVVTLRPND